MNTVKIIQQKFKIMQKNFSSELKEKARSLLDPFYLKKNDGSHDAVQYVFNNLAPQSHQQLEHLTQVINQEYQLYDQKSKRRLLCFRNIKET